MTGDNTNTDRFGGTPTIEEQNERMYDHIAEVYAEDYSEPAAEVFREHGQVYVNDAGNPSEEVDAVELLTAWPANSERPAIPAVIPIVHDRPDGFWILMETEGDGGLDYYTNPHTGELKGTVSTNNQDYNLNPDFWYLCVR